MLIIINDLESYNIYKLVLIQYEQLNQAVATEQYSCYDYTLFLVLIFSCIVSSNRIEVNRILSIVPTTMCYVRFTRNFYCMK